MNIAFVFPGQGSQAIGMGKDFYNNFSVARDVFDEVDDALSEKLSKLIFEGTEEELIKTQNTQPSLMAVSLAIVRTIEYLSGKKIQDICSVFAGHSLGEYSAICSGGGISIRDCAKVLRARGSLMQNSATEGEYSMAAIIGASRNNIEFVISEAELHGICELANDNSKDQVVISGHDSAVNFAIAMFKDNGAKAIKLRVSAPFHCSLMKSAAIRMKNVLDNVIFQDTKIPIIDNISLELTKDISFLKEKLIEQISGTVRWRETMDIITENYDSVHEVGSGRILSGLFKKSYPDFNVQTLNSIKEVEEFVCIYS